MHEVLTMDEIKARYPDEWVMLGDPVVDGGKVQSGTLLRHGKDKEAVYRYPPPGGPRRVALFWSGEWPKNLRCVL